MQSYQLRDRKKPKFSPKTRRHWTFKPTDAEPTTAIATGTKVNKQLCVDIEASADMDPKEADKSTDQLIKEMWLDMKSMKNDVKSVNDNIDSVKEEIKSNYDELIVKLDDFKRNTEELEGKVDLAHERIATLESCYMDLYHENRALKNKQKACNIIIRGVPESPKERMYETMGDLFGAIGGDANYLLTDGAARIGAQNKQSTQGMKTRGATAGNKTEPRPIRVFCKSLLLKGEIFRGLDRIKAVPKFANVRLSNDLNDDEMMEYKEVQLLHTAASKMPNVTSKMKGKKIEVDGKTYERKNFQDLPHGLSLEKASTILTKEGLAFASHCSPYSNLYPVEIEYEGLSYNCSEQFIMYNKAQVGNDEVVAAKILSETNPYTIMYLGKSIKGCPKWKDMEKKIVKKAVYLKFSQNKGLHKKIKEVKANRFYECTMHPLYGAGFTLATAEQDTAAVKPTHQNYMGAVLFEYKSEALAEDS